MAPTSTSAFGTDARDMLEVNGDWVHNFSFSNQPFAGTFVGLAATDVLDGAPPFRFSVNGLNHTNDFSGRRHSLTVTSDFRNRSLFIVFLQQSALQRRGKTAALRSPRRAIPSVCRK